MACIEPFDKYSDEYDRWFEEHEEIYESEVALMRLLLPGPGTTCFEITEIKQTLLPGEPAGKTIDGYGKGSFVGIGARRTL